MTARDWGAAICAVVAGLALYELAAIYTRLPTISRMLQGWRDEGHVVAVAVVTVLCVVILLLFAGWLFHHLLFDERSVILP